jgi:acyl-CoA dehydrogenase
MTPRLRVDFALPAELVDLRDGFKRFLAREVAPLEHAVADQLASAHFAPDDLRSLKVEVRRRSAAAGFYAPHLPESVGGFGLSTLGLVLLVEEAARSGLLLAMASVSAPETSGPTALLLRLPEHLRDVYLRPLMTADSTMCFALTEPGAGSDAAAIATRARREGGDWVLNGHKHYITNAAEADFALTVAGGEHGITAFVVPRESYRLGRVQYSHADSHPSEIFFEESRVPADHVVGSVGAGLELALDYLCLGRTTMAAQALGLAENVLAAAIGHARSRRAFGRPLSANQGVSFPLADCHIEIEAMRWLTYKAACELDSPQDSVLAASIAKYFATERAYLIADRCLQVFGGMGLMRDGPVERSLRHLRMLRIVEGASEIQKVLIARTLGL